nr:unnamed protein product [Digitaria exilis]
MKITSTLMAILVLQAVLVSAAMAEGKGVGVKMEGKSCGCTSCSEWLGILTCDDLLPSCYATCKTSCEAVPTYEGMRFKCRDVLPEGCDCKSNSSST